MASATSVGIQPNDEGQGPDPKATPGVTAPQEGDQQQGKYGPNNKNLPEPLITELQTLCRKARRENLRARLEELRSAREQHFFWRHKQYLWWDETSDRFNVAFENFGSMDSSGDLGGDLGDQPHYMYVTNIYQAFGLSIMAVLAQDTPKLKALPVSTQSDDDISTAQMANDAIDLMERNNDSKTAMQELAFHLWTDSKCGAYIRYVVDGQRFGFRAEDQIDQQPQKLGEDSFVCPDCQTETPATQMLDACPNCDAPLSLDNFKEAPTVSVPVVTDTIQTPNGQEVITYYGSLNLCTPIYANEMCEFGYLGLDMEVHRGKLRAAYPHVQDKISAGLTVTGDQSFARTARMQVALGGMLSQSGDALYELVTYERSWMRPWMLWEVENKDKRAELLALFPNGVYVAFAGDTYCESRNESMDDCWEVMYPMPGDGQNRTSIGSIIMDVQKRLNDLSNLSEETYEYGVPPIYADTEVLDFDAINNQPAEPGAHYPVKSKGANPIADSFYQPTPASVPRDMLQVLSELFGTIPQFLTGAMPSLFGGNMEDQKTAQAYAQSQAASQGRVGIFWARINTFHQNVMWKALKCMAKNRAVDIEIPSIDGSGNYAASSIPIDAIQGNIKLYPEDDSSFPKLWQQQRAEVMQILNTPIGQDEEVLKTLSLPSNQQWLKDLIGIRQLVLYGAASRKKQNREIEMLLQGQPVEVDPILDDHEVELETMKEYSDSDMGFQQKYSNPFWPLFVMHAQAHQMALAATMAPAPAPGGEAGPPKKQIPKQGPESA